MQEQGQDQGAGAPPALQGRPPRPREMASGRRRLHRMGAALLAGLSLALVTPPALADEYDPQEAGHPLRIVAYVVHPVGVVLDLLIFRPAHWIVHHESLAAFFGHDRYDD